MSKARSLSLFISDPTIEASEIGSGAITTDKIADLNVTHDKLHSNLDLTAKTVTFADDAISGNKIHSGVISNFASTGIDDNAISTAITIDNSGKVGVGITSGLSTKFEVYETAAANSFIKVTSTYADGYDAGVVLSNTHTGGRDYKIISTNDSRGTIGGGKFAIIDNTAGNNTHRLLITSAGNVGIGTVNPASKLHVTNTTPSTPIATFENPDVHEATIRFKTAHSANSDYRIGASITVADAFEIYSVNASTHRLVVNSSGNVGIGTNNPLEKLHVNGGIRTESYASNAHTIEFPAYFNSGVNHTVATVDSNTVNTGTVVIATLEFATLYSYAGSTHSMGTIWASARRINNNTAWRELNQATVNVGDTTVTPGFYWDTSTGNLMCNVGGAVQVTAKVTITYHNCVVNRNYSTVL